MLDQPIEVRTRSVGPWPMNSYALVCPVTGESVLIDPGAEPETLLEMLAETRPAAILLTHTHPDHIGALAELRDQLRVPLMAYPGHHHHGMQLRVDRALNDGDQVTFGAQTIRVYHTPGHSADMLCFASADDTAIIVGDTIFAGGPGRTWSPEDFQTTLQTLREVVLHWPSQALCYPGHGPAFRLGDVRPLIEAFVAREHADDYFGNAEW